MNSTPPLILANPTAEQAKLDEAARLDLLATALLDGFEQGKATAPMMERFLRLRAKAASMRGGKYTPEQAVAELVDRGLCKP